jgi:hypothetical protein
VRMHDVDTCSCIPRASSVPLTRPPRPCLIEAPYDALRQAARSASRSITVIDASEVDAALSATRRPLTPFTHSLVQSRMRQETAVAESFHRIERTLMVRNAAADDAFAVRLIVRESRVHPLHVTAVRRGAVWSHRATPSRSHP